MNRLKGLLQSALPPTRDDPPTRDLWPELRQRVASESASPADAATWRAVPWLDWALAAAVALVALAFPAAVPLFFYYL